MNEAAIQRMLAPLDQTTWIVTSSVDNDRGGLVATFVHNVSLVPALPRLLVAIATHHHTWSLIQASGRFAAHLVDEAQCGLLWRFGLGTGHSIDKFSGVSWRPSSAGSPLLDNALAWLDCTVETAFDIGDRSLFLGAIVDGQVNHPGRPMTAARLIELADEEQRARLEEELRRDQALDAEAILKWRGRAGR
jgi:flavin reductase (DIM6/NTAB) family NADH-FMN oxidoreductase RutF